MLLYEPRITEEKLGGLQQDNMKKIRSCAKMLSEDAA